MNRYAYCIALLALALFTAGRASAAIYMKFDGIDGDVTAAGHEKWVDLHTFEFGVTNSGGGAQPSAVKVTSFVNVASPKLFLATVNGTTIPAATIDFVTAAEPVQPYLQYKLENVQITSYQVGSSGDRPIESLSMNYTKIDYRYIPMKDDGSLGTPIEAQWLVGTQPVPEPYTWALLAAGLATLIVGQRRARRLSA